MTEPNEPRDPSSGAWFRQWMAVYKEGEDTFRLASEYVPTAKKALAEARTRLDRIEGDIAANGGTPECPIDGSNAEKRKGQLTRALEGDGAYVAARVAVREAEAAVTTHEGKLSEARHTMERARHAFEFSREWQGLQAALERNRVPAKE